MGQRGGRGRRGVRGEGFMVKNDKDDGYDYGNPNRHEIKELRAQIATLSDKVQYVLLNRQVATLMKKVRRLLPSSKVTNDCQSQLESSFDYKEFEEERIFKTDEVGGGVKDDNAFEIDDIDGESEELPIYDKSANEDFVGKFKGVLVFDEFPNHDIDGDDDVSLFLREELEDNFKDGGFKDLPVFDEFLKEENDLEGDSILEIGEDFKDDIVLKIRSNLEDDLVFKSSGEFENVPIYDEFEEEFCVDNEEGKLVDLIKENFLVDRQESKEVISEDPYALVVSPKLDEVVFDYPPMSEEFGEPKLDDCFHYLPSEVHMVQRVFELTSFPCTCYLGLPKEGKDDLGQLVDPLGFVFKQASFEHSVVTFQRAKVDSSWCDLEMCVMCYYNDILIYKTHGYMDDFIAHKHGCDGCLQKKADIEDWL